MTDKKHAGGRPRKGTLEFRGLAERIGRGESLPAALAQQPETFPPVQTTSPYRTSSACSAATSTRTRSISAAVPASVVMIRTPLSG